MDFNSYIISETKTAHSLSLASLPIDSLRSDDKYFEIKKLRRKAFTLAETLITLSVIGIVAALTVPTLVTNAQKAAYVAGLKKAYSQLNNAVRMLPITVGCSGGDYECAQLTTQNLSAEFKLAKPAYQCNLFPWESSERAACIQTTDGITYILASEAYPVNSTVGVDVNGDKGPNQFGRDRFLFDLRPLYDPNYTNHKNDNSCKTVIPTGSKLSEQCTAVSYWNKDPKNPACSKSRLSWECTGRVLEEGAMNY